MLEFYCYSHENLGILSIFSVQFYVNFLTVLYIFSYYQSLLQIRAHICNIIFMLFDILEIKITYEDSDQSRNV